MDAVRKRSLYEAKVICMLRAMIRPAATLVMIICATLLTPTARAQLTINLNSVIGVSGDNAANVDGPGNAVNFTGYASNSVDLPTTLTAAGSTGSSSFNFNTGFADTLDRSTGSSAGAGNVFVDHKYDSSSTSTLILDTNNDGSFLDESALTGFGMHGDTFITFDLDVIRTNFLLAPGTAFTLAGSAGEANFTGYTTSAAIILDGSQLAVFDWTDSGPINQFSSYSLSIAGSARYLTFAGLSGLDNNNWGAHVGFADVQLLTAVPEPSAYAALTGLAALGLAMLRRRRT